MAPSIIFIVADNPLYWRMNHRHQRALRQGPRKYLKVDEREYLFNITQDARERAYLATHESERLIRMREEWLRRECTVPAITEDASVSLGYSVKDMP